MAYKIINLDTINQSMNGNTDLIKQLVDLYITQSPIDFKALENAISTGEYTDIREKAHHIKPTMQYIGAIDLLEDFQNLENLAKEQVPLSQINSLFHNLSTKFSVMLEELNVLSKS